MFANMLTKVTHLMAGKTKKVTHLGASLSPSFGDARKGPPSNFLPQTHDDSEVKLFMHVRGTV